VAASLALLLAYDGGGRPTHEERRGVNAINDLGGTTPQSAPVTRAAFPGSSIGGDDLARTAYGGGLDIANLSKRAFGR
jgi:hypothetical protein